MPLFKLSSKSFPRSRDLTREVPYVLRLEFSGLKSETRSIVGRPIACFKCNGYLTDPEQILEDEKTGQYFICPFCGTLNVVEGQIIVAGDDVDFVIEPPPSSTDTGQQPSLSGFNSLLAVLDLSGSMSGASLSAVKRSLSTTIDSIAANSPEAIFGLIEFDSDVQYVNMDGSGTFQLPSNTFFRLDDIIGYVDKVIDKLKFLPVGKNSTTIKQYIQSLTTKGITALGPAMAFAYAIARHRRISRIVLLTDGLANTGIGSFEGVQAIPPKEFYTDLARQFLDIGATIDVVGLATSTGIEMKTLGIMPDITNGQIFYVTPNELDKSVAELASAELIGRDVEVRIITPPGVTIRDASGMSSAVIDSLVKRRAAKVGSVGTEHEMCVSLSPESKITADEIPIQIQVEYIDSEGSRRVRAVTTKVRVTDDEAEIVAGMDPKVTATFVTQKAGEAATGGSVDTGRKMISSFRAAMKKRAKSAPTSVREEFDVVDLVLSEEEAELVEMEEIIAKAPPTAQSAAADMVFTSGLRQKRRSSKEMFEQRRSKSDDDDDES